eukprot:TRINITY_DN56656_c0_g1_i1.p1 TRINITY_DN56656_c0_g1~~TRINITY_DN56656_c0_g1_i1.p1  ORF type:complete len:491 (-),score=70.24 TRINITY_DN56656_c0_g1_i1:26-1402(-)
MAQEHQSWGLREYFLIVVMLVFGSSNTLIQKFAYQTCAPTLPGSATPTTTIGPDAPCREGEILYNHPWLMNSFMFLGEASLLVAYNLPSSRARRALRLQQSGSGVDATARMPLSGASGTAGRKPPLYLYAIPAFCDVFGTGLASAGMLYIDSAIWQMLRSSIIVFSAIFTVLLLRRRIDLSQWLAVAIVCFGLLLVGLASFLDAQDDSAGAGSGSTADGGQRLLGLCLVTGAQIFAAIQVVFEEKLLTDARYDKVSAKKVVGMEGVWGSFYMVILLAIMSNVPSQQNPMESAPEGLYMVTHTPSLLVFALTYMCCIAVYNLTGIMVGKKMSTVVRCFVDSSRTLVVWGCNLFIYYFVSPKYGTAWTKHSWLILLGFAVLIVGTLMYNQALPCQRKADGSPDLAVESEIRGATLSTDDVLSKVRHTVEYEELLEEAEAAAQRTTGAAELSQQTVHRETR